MSTLLISIAAAIIFLVLASITEDDHISWKLILGAIAIVAVGFLVTTKESLGGTTVLQKSDRLEVCRDR